jgi:hypothetical protein
MRIIDLHKRRLQGGAPPPPAASIAITAPAESSIYASDTDVVITCDIVGTPSKVEYYNGLTLIGTKSVAPFDSFTWTGANTPDGTSPALSAKLFIGGIQEAISNTVTITINTASGYDADYQAVLDVATANGISWPSQAQIDIDNQLMIDIKASGYYAKRAAIAKVKGTASIPFKLICWKRKILMNAYGGLTWDADGVLPNGTNGYIDPLFNGQTDVNYGLDDAGYDWVSPNVPLVTTSSRCVFGYYNGVSADDYINIAPNAGTMGQASLHAIWSSTGAYLLQGYNAINRNGFITDRNNGASQKSAQPLAKPPKVFMLARYWETAATDNYWNEKVSFMSIGYSVLSDYTTIKPILE